MANPDTPAMTPSPKRDVSAATSDELATVVMRAQAFTSATGAAIALTENDEMICRASSGTTAPDVGVHLSIEGSFTGLAVTGGQALRCDDSETDSRVDAAACRLMRTRSMCVVPVRDHGTIAGVVAVFSSNPNAFSDYHMAVLKTMADLISQSLAKGHSHDAASTPATKPRVEPRAPAAAAPTTPAPSRPAVQPLVAATATPPPKPVAVPPPAKPIAVPAPSAPVAAAPVAAAPAPARIPAPAPKPKIEQPEPAKFSAAAPPKEKKKEERITPAPRKEKREPSGAVPSFGGDRGSIFAQDAPQTESGSNKSMLLIGSGVAAVVVIGLVLWLALGSSSASKTASAGAPPATTNTATTAPQPVSTSETVIPQPATTATSTPVPARAEKPAADKSEPAKQEKPAVAQPAPIMMAGGTVAKSTVSTDVAAPTLMPSGGSPGLPALGSAAPAVPTLHAVTVAPHLLQSVKPVYPLAAKQMGMHGSVVLEVKIDSRGNVSDVRPISGNAFFYDAARSAIRQWKYKPQTVNGQPTDSIIQVTVKFEAPR